MNIAIFAGEVSGDLIGGALARELLDREPDLSLWGLGSEAMREAGVELLEDSASWGAISITEAIVKVPGLLTRVAPRVKRALKQRRPDAVVLIDFGAFNVRAARYCKSLGLKVCYYFPPGSWRRQSNRGAELAQITDLIASPFPWTTERLLRFGANAVTVGHPILERAEAQLTRAEFAAQFGMEPSRPIIGLLPGSRRHEVHHLMPVLLEAARQIYRQAPDAQFVVGVAPSLSLEQMRVLLTDHPYLRDRLSEIWHEFVRGAGERVLRPLTRTARALTGRRGPLLVTQNGVLMPLDVARQEMAARRRFREVKPPGGEGLPPTVLVKGLTYDVMAHSDLLLTCSGTATLEAALFTTPMVILYRGSRIMELEYRLRGLDKKIRFIGLPNILADRSIVPELIQGAASPEAITEHAVRLLNDVETRHRAKEGLREVREMLGAPGASERTAQLVLELARKR